MPALPLRLPLRPLVVGALVLGTAGCTTFGSTDVGAPGAVAPPAPPPAPPAACLLDTDALAAGTGLSWAPDVTTASDTRCVYDPAPPAPGAARPSTDPTTVQPPDAAAADPAEFLAVDLTPATDAPPAEQLDALAQACESGSREPAGPDGFVCSFPDGNVFAARVRADDVITLAASATPAGTTATALSAELARQLDTQI